MRVVVLFLTILFTSCSSGINSNQAKYNQIVQIKNSVVEFNTNSFESKAISYLVAGTMLQQQNKFANAILEFQEALRYDSSAAIEYAIANSYLELNKKENAKEHLFRSTTLNPEFIQSYDLLTEIFLFTRELEKADVTNSRALELEKSNDRILTKALILENSNPEYALSIYDSISSRKYENLINERKVYLYKKLGKTDLLVKDLKKTQKREPFNTQVAREIFQIYLEQNQLDKAIEYMSLVDTLYYGQEQETYYLLLASALLQSRPIDSLLVEKYLDQVKGTLLFNSELMYYTGLLASNIRNTKKRDFFFERVLKITSENSDFKVGVSEALYFDAEYKRSLEVLKGINPDSLKQGLYYHSLKGMNYTMLKDYDNALLAYDRILEKDTSFNNYVTLTMIGEIFDLKGMTDSAIYYYELHYNYDSNSTYLLNNYAYALSKIDKDLDRALKMSEKTLKESPENSAFLDTFGWIKYKQGEIEVARDYILKAIEIGGVSAEVYEHLGDIYMQLNKIDKAKEMYKKSLELEYERFELEDKVKM